MLAQSCTEKSRPGYDERDGRVRNGRDQPGDDRAEGVDVAPPADQRENADQNSERPCDRRDLLERGSPTVVTLLRGRKLEVVSGYTRGIHVLKKCDTAHT